MAFRLAAPYGELIVSFIIIMSPHSFQFMSLFRHSDIHGLKKIATDRHPRLLPAILGNWKGRRSVGRSAKMWLTTRSMSPRFGDAFRDINSFDESQSR